MSEDKSGMTILENMHTTFREALRHREQEIFQYLIILAPALGGFGWLLYSNDYIKTEYFVYGTVGILLLLLLGAVYSLALGYNYRYIVLQLAKLDSMLGIKNFMLEGWPKSAQNFICRYKKFCHLPWCTPPGIIKVFWWGFLGGMVFVMIVGWFVSKSETLLYWGGLCILLGGLLPIYYGCKLRQLCQDEPEEWKPIKNATGIDA